MSIRQYGDSFLVDVTVNKQRHRMVFLSREEASDAEKKLTTQIIPGLKGWTIEYAKKQCQEAIWTGTAGAPNAIRNAQYAVEFFGPTTPLNDITTEWIDAYIARLKQLGNSGGTINRKLAALSSILTFASRRGQLTTKPHLERQTEHEGRIRFLTNEEEQLSLHVFEKWGKADHAEACQVLVDTGMRPSELWLLEPRDYDAKTGLVSLWRVKNHKPRSVPATKRVKDIIARRIETTLRGQRLFPFSNSWMEDAWDRMKAHIGLTKDKQFVPYSLRHTCASRLVQRGVHLKVVQEWMGHKTIQITMRYAHLCPANFTDAVKVLEEC